MLRARFFADAKGIVIEKAKPLASRLRSYVYDRDGGICQSCGQSVARYGHNASPFSKTSCQVDHIFPRSRGGQNHPSNLRLLCITCNSQKGAR